MVVQHQQTLPDRITNPMKIRHFSSTKYLASQEIQRAIRRCSFSLRVSWVLLDYISQEIQRAIKRCSFSLRISRSLLHYLLLYRLDMERHQHLLFLEYTTTQLNERRDVVGLMSNIGTIDINNDIINKINVILCTAM